MAFDSHYMEFVLYSLKQRYTRKHILRKKLMHHMLQNHIQLLISRTKEFDSALSVPVLFSQSIVELYPSRNVVLGSDQRTL